MDWVKKFSVTGQVLENWIQVQNLWMYLEAVFIGGDISKQLPLETKRFTVKTSLNIILLLITIYFIIYIIFIICRNLYIIYV